ncbi:MAG: pilus assembly protein TadG-related protein [Chloroflexota bacterium]|nr:pilus assembly protein TadG-related protein [Chloroflexota bacterium]
MVWFTVALPLFLSIAGLAIDGGVLLASRRQVQSVADGAARAGATRLDVDRLRSSGGADVQLDPALARDTTWRYLDQRLARELEWPAAPTAAVDVSARRVHVVIQGTLPTAFLRVVHIDSVPVTASAFADVQYGIRAAGGS